MLLTREGELTSLSLTRMPILREIGAWRAVMIGRAHRQDGHSSHWLAAPEIDRAGTNQEFVTPAIEISWEPVAGAVLHRAQISVDGVTWSDSQVATTGQSKLAIAGLQKDTVYWCRLRAETTERTSEWSTPVTAKTGSGFHPGIYFAILYRYSSSASVAWHTNYYPNVYQSRLQISTDDVNWSDVGLVNGTSSFYTVEGLTSDATYFFRVRGEDSTGVSDWSDVKQAK